MAPSGLMSAARDRNGQTRLALVHLGRRRPRRPGHDTADLLGSRPGEAVAPDGNRVGVGLVVGQHVVELASPRIDNDRARPLAILQVDHGRLHGRDIGLLAAVHVFGIDDGTVRFAARFALRIQLTFAALDVALVDRTGAVRSILRAGLGCPPHCAGRSDHDCKRCCASKVHRPLALFLLPAPGGAAIAPRLQYLIGCPGRDKCPAVVSVEYRECDASFPQLMT